MPKQENPWDIKNMVENLQLYSWKCFSWNGSDFHAWRLIPKCRPNFEDMLGQDPLVLSIVLGWTGSGPTFIRLDSNCMVTRHLIMDWASIFSKTAHIFFKNKLGFTKFTTHLPSPERQDYSFVIVKSQTWNLSGNLEAYQAEKLGTSLS